MTGANPSRFPAGAPLEDHRDPIGWKHPVEYVSTNEIMAVLERFQLRLPSEIEWEAAARGTSKHAYASGESWQSLREHGNFSDQALEDDFQQGYERVDWDDGYPATAPIGSFLPNAFGLYDVSGNVYEATTPSHHTDAARVDPSAVVFRGGSWQSEPQDNRLGNRWIEGRDFRRSEIGFRPCRSVFPTETSR